MATIIGTNGDDIGFFAPPFLLFGTTGDDTIQGLAGNDSLLGNGGNDLLDGGTGEDFMQGGDGNDTYIVDNSDEQVVEDGGVNSGLDIVKSSVSFTLPANVEHLTLTGTENINGIGNTGVNNIIGNNGNNLLRGNGGDDFLDGGKGFDTVDESRDSNFSIDDNVILFSGGGDSLVSIEAVNIFGGASNNTINAANFSGEAFLVGKDGSDILIGGKNNDLLIGDDFSAGVTVGDDTLIGGDGTDTVVAQTVTNFILTNTSLKGEGNDTLSSIEKAKLTGNSSSNTIDASAFSGSVLAFGLDGDDVLLGAKGNDTFFGGKGSDVLAGGAGNDKLFGALDTSTQDSNAPDKLVYNTGTAFKTADIGIDTIEDFVHGSDKIVLDKKTFTTIGSNTGTGFSQASEFKVVTSDSAAQTSSADIVYNSANGKLFYNQNGTSSGFGSGAQFATLTGKPTLSATDFVLQSGSTLGLIKGTPITQGTNSSNVIQGQNIGGILDGKGGNDTLFAKGGDDVVLGGNGNDAIDGGTGDDILFGGNGKDTLKGGNGIDTFVLAPGSGVDVIKDFIDGIDHLGLVNDLSFDQLQFVRKGSSTVIRSSGQDLAVVNGMKPNQFTATDFVSVGFSPFDGMNVPSVLG